MSRFIRFADMPALATMDNPSCLPATPKPDENDYVGLLRWINDPQSAGHNWRQQTDNNRSRAARLLSNVVGWTIDVNSWRKAEARRQR